MLFRLLTDPLYGTGVSAKFEGADDLLPMDADVGLPKGGGDPSKDPPAGDPPKADDSAGGDTFDLKIGGEVRSLTLDELKTYASKAAGAEAKFEEAANMRKQAEQATKLMSALDTIKEGPGDRQQQAMVEACNILGVNMSELQSLTNDPKAPSGTPSPTTPPAEIKLEQLPEKARKAIDAAEKAELVEIRKDIEETTKKGIDNDEALDKMVGGVKDNPELQEVLYEMAIDEVQNAIVVRGEEFGPDMIKSVVQKVRSTIKRLGIPAKAATLPPVLGIGPSEGYSPAVLSDEPIKRVASTEADYEDNLVQRYMQKQRMAMQQ
jgi:hypothetical protein